MSTLSILTLLLRIPFISRYLFEWDSIQFALSIHSFNIPWHQPHPPGYIFFVLLIQAIHKLIPSDNLAIVVCAIFFSIITVALHYLMSMRLLNGYRLAIASSLILITSPVFWFYGEIASVYTVEAAGSLLAIYLLWESLSRKESAGIGLAVFIAGLVLGLRQSLLIVLLPLLVYSIYKRRDNLRTIFGLFLIFTLAVCTWLIPTIMSVGGLESYLDSTSGLAGPVVERIQYLFGGIPQYLSINLSNYLVWLSLGVTPFAFILILVVLTQQFRSYKFLGLYRQSTQFILLWVLPSVVTYLLYIEKPGYLLSIIPPLIIVAVKGLSILAKRIETQWHYAEVFPIFTVIILTTSSLWFIYPLSSNQKVQTTIQPPSYINPPPLSDYSWDISSRLIRERDTSIATLVRVFREHPFFLPSNTLILYSGGFPTWRHLMYYLPEYDTLWLVNDSVSGDPGFGSEIYSAKNWEVASFSGLPFWQHGDRENDLIFIVDPSIDELLWFTDKDTSIYKDVMELDVALRTLLLEPKGLIIATPFGDQPLVIRNFKFIRGQGQ